MSNNAKYYLYTLLDFGFTFGGSAGVIIYNYISPNTSTGFKLSFTGIVLVLVLFLSAKTIFEHTYQNKMNNLLQQLANATDVEVKQTINNDITKLKTANVIYERITMLMPFAILFVVSVLGASMLEELQGTLELILVSMGAGSVFNVIKQPIAEKRAEEVFKARVKKQTNN